MIGWILLTIGGLFCSFNAYLSWLRYPLFRLLGGARDDYRWSSGIPVLGSLLVVLDWVGWLRHEYSVALDVLAIVLLAIDSGGIHWFLLVMVLDRFWGQNRSNS
ncbi:MAG: hypothetical protein V3W41_07700 [Planctomycetota bacterium]